MRIALCILMIVALGLVSVVTVRAQTFSARLNGSQEVPLTGSAATGTCSFQLDLSKFLTYTIHYFNLSSAETAAHVHGAAPVGQEAGVLFPLPLGDSISGSVGPLTLQQESQLNAGLLYVNIHSVNFPNGEIRGQIYNTIAVQANSWGGIKELYR